MYLDFNQFYLEYLISLSKSSLNETILSLDVLGRGRRGITPFFGLLSSSLCSLWMNVNESQVCQFTFRLWVMKCANVHKNLHATAHPLVCIFDQSEATWDGVTRQCDAKDVALVFHPNWMKDRHHLMSDAFFCEFNLKLCFGKIMFNPSTFAYGRVHVWYVFCLCVRLWKREREYEF